jgi:UDP-N-acetylmuramoyl-L-alanyl-D-glutamate--2,6-diaminopimelate ligase
MNKNFSVTIDFKPLAAFFVTPPNEQIFNNVYLHDQLQQATASDVVIYQLASTELGQKSLNDRLGQLNAAPRLIILSSTPKLAVDSRFQIAVIKDGQWLLFLESLFNQVFPIPSGVKFVGITGTNGKTSTAFFLNQLGSILGKKSLLFGTLGMYLGTQKQDDFSLTSPSYFYFRRTLFQYADQFELCVFEMSSHALDQQRFYNIKLSAAGWTSFTQDHLDYHITMEHYFASKMKIFDYLESAAYVYFPPSERKLFSCVNHPLARFIEQYPWSPSIESKNSCFSMQFMKDNLAVSLSILYQLYPELKNTEIAWEALPAVPGRMNQFVVSGAEVFIDFAHTPDALANACQSLRKNFPSKKLKVLFGCGGNRDRLKRPLMGTAVSEWAHYIYLTSDNPRFEDPEIIMDDVVPGITVPFERCKDREITLMKALAELSGENVLLVAGKGHENYIQIKDVKHPYSDESVVKRFLGVIDD